MFETQDCNEPSVNKYGDVVTLNGVKYRWRDGYVYSRNEIGQLLVIDWHKVPQCVRDIFRERINYA